ncbi:hypothetical protein CONLIGDRAFT_584725, partial [Coniochaeta ligniaria NRRL 30616]
TACRITGLSMGERTGSRILQYLWSYVLDLDTKASYMQGEKQKYRLRQLNRFRRTPDTP